MTGRVAGKTALVSGAATGIGQSIAARLAAEGAQVAVADIDETRGAEVVKAIREADGDALFVSLDVTEETDWQAAIDVVESELGSLDILVNNAGIAIVESVDKMSFEDWRAVMAVNIDGVFLGTKHAVPAMRRAGGGSIINISSILGLTGLEKLSAYCASKGAVRLFTKSTAIQYAGENIRANSVHPGSVATDMNAERRSDPELLAESLSRIPLGRIGEPEDIALGVLYLASDESSFITGSELVIDGGFSAQ